MFHSTCSTITVQVAITSTEEDRYSHNCAWMCVCVCVFRLFVQSNCGKSSKSSQCKSLHDQAQTWFKVVCERGQSPGNEYKLT